MSGRVFAGLFLIIVGAWIYLSHLGILNFSRDWPIILIIFGLYLILKREKRKRNEKIRKVLEKLDKGEIDSETALREIKGGKESE